MNEVSKLAKLLHEKIPEAFPWVTDWKEILKHVKKPDEIVFNYYDRFGKVFKHQSSVDELSDDTSALFNSSFVEGLQDKLE